MIYYSIQDITDAYDISRAALKYKLRSGKLKFQKLITSRSNPHYFKYIIPETEIVKLEKFKISEPVASADAQPDYYEKYWQEYDEQEKQWLEEAQKRQEERKKFLDYYEYLQSKEWQIVRRKRLQIDGYKCQMCGTGKNLQVHHISYEHLGQEKEIDDLVTLCKECHQKVHEEDLR